jgi:hypothetical protein
MPSLHDLANFALSHLVVELQPLQFEYPEDYPDWNPGEAMIFAFIVTNKSSCTLKDIVIEVEELNGNATVTGVGHLSWSGGMVPQLEFVWEDTNQYLISGLVPGASAGLFRYFRIRALNAGPAHIVVRADAMEVIPTASNVIVGDQEFTIEP